MTLPTPDAQSARFLSQQPRSTQPDHSMSPITPHALHLPATPRTPAASPFAPMTESPNLNTRERVVDFADHPWNLASGGLKTLTAKRELPPGLERRTTPTEKRLETETATRSYTFALVVLACILVMLISGGVVLFIFIAG